MNSLFARACATRASLFFATLAAAAACAPCNVRGDLPSKWIEVPGNGWSVREPGRELDAPGRLSSDAEHRYGDWSRGWAHYCGPAQEPATFDIFQDVDTDGYFMPDIEKACFPLNFGLLEGSTPGDFLPVASTISDDSLPLIPNRLANSFTGWNGLSRPTLDEKIDLVTGVPIAKFEDLSLPFGGSTFRLIRTRSSDRPMTCRPPDFRIQNRSPDDTRWWDWAGAGWMISENPILIVDSTMADQAGRDGSPRCTFWLDAFHSIPFDWVDAVQVEGEQRGFYESSPRFRAKMIASRMDGTVRKNSNEAGGPSRRTQANTSTNDLVEKLNADDLPCAVVWPDSSVPALTSTEKAALRNWQVRCRYTYAAEACDHIGEGNIAAVSSPPLLVRTQVERRREGATGTDYRTDAPGRNRVFVYSGDKSPIHSQWLALMYDDEGVLDAAKAIAEHSSQSVSPTQSRESALRAVSAIGRDFESNSGGMTNLQDFVPKLRESAMISFLNARESAEDSTPDYSGRSGDFGQPGVDDHPESLLGGAPGQWCYDSGFGTVGAVSFRGPSGSRKYYRLTRFAMMPADPVGSAIHLAWTGDADPIRPTRSVFHSPFWWQTYAVGNSYEWPRAGLSWDDGMGLSGSVSGHDPNYTDARWAVFVDEFPTYESLRDGRPMSVTGPSGTKSSFISGSISRQIFGINPQGNVLWKKSYFLRDDHFTESGDTGLTERWEYKTGHEILTDLGKDPASASQMFRDERFLVAKKSVGYAAASIATNNLPTSEGLIHVFEYDDVCGSAPLQSSPEAAGFPWGERIKPVATGITKGDVQSGSSTPATVYYQTRTFYDASDPTLVTASASLTTPTTTRPNTPSEADAILSRLVTTKVTNSEGLYTRISTKSVSPPHCARPDQPDSKYYDVSFDIAGPTGLTTWSVSATVSDYTTIPSTSADPNVRVALTYFVYDGEGNPTDIWFDVDRNQQNHPHLQIPQTDLDLLPSGLNRISSDSTPKELWTHHEYDNEGIKQSTFPSGRLYARRRFEIPDAEDPDKQVNQGRPITRIFKMNELEPDGSNPAIVSTRSLCSIEDYGQYECDMVEMVPFSTGDGAGAAPMGTVKTTYKNRLIRTYQIWFTSAFNLDASQAYENFEIKPPAELSYDSAGRLKAVKTLDLDWNGNSASSASIVDNGDRVRIKEMDGNASMQIRDARGYHVRTYTGTDAFDWDDNIWHDSSRTGSDMILRERTEFGRGVTDATLPARKWTYLNTPSRGWNTSNLAPFGPAPADDPEGELTETKYDWRMRPVRVDVFGPMGEEVQYRSGEDPDPETPAPTRPRLSTRLTYLDHADRPIIEASFGDSSLVEITNAIDPCLFAPDSPRLASESAIDALIADILGAKATSVVRTIFYSDGSTKERRTYRPQSITPGSGYSGASDYVAERFGYGAGGREVFAQRPSSPVQLTVFDNTGHTVSERSVLPRSTGGTLDLSYELSRTEYGYDNESSVILTARWERIMPAGESSSAAPTGDASLSTDNAVCQLTENWYDPSKRLIATADYGTGDTSAGTSGMFVTPPTAPTLAGRLGVRLGAPNARPELEVPGVENASAWLVDRSDVDPSVSLTVHCYDRAGNKVGTATQRNFASAEQDAAGESLPACAVRVGARRQRC